MASSFGNLFNNMGDVLKLVQDKDFRKFLSDPRVQELMKDEGFKQAVQNKDFSDLQSNQSFMELMKDPEIRSCIEKFGKKYHSSN